ncbi:hypothetical protein SVAN01_11774 [Stagonosporopsis vannaccii]|nr:hypothetical protein SVAN01_11774 [Stagonosporopsis vannaccii]
MPVAAIAARPSSTLAIVATLGSVALLSFLLRLCTHGRRLHSRGTEQWVLCVAAICVVGDVVVTGMRAERDWAAIAGSDRDVLILVWVETLVQILGLGSVKLSVALAVLSRVVRNWHRHLVVGYICLITLLTMFWFSSTLLFNGPITVEWSATTDPAAAVYLLDFINSVLDIASGVLISILPLPLLWTTHTCISLCTHLTLAAVYTSTTAALTFASLRTYLFHSIWQAPNDTLSALTPSTTLCTSISLALALLSASLLTLPHFLSSLRLRPRRLTKQTPTSTASSYPTNTFASTDTVIRHPAPSPLTLRFHDTESNLDFDMAPTTSTTSRAQTMRSLHRNEHPAHNRRVSDWSQFSGFTFYSSPPHSTVASARQSARQSLHCAPPAASAPAACRRSRHASVGEMEARTRGLAAAKGGSDNARAGSEGMQGSEAERHVGVGVGVGVSAGVGVGVGMAVSTLSGMDGRDAKVPGEEMQELARLFADRTRSWGGEGKQGA